MSRATLVICQVGLLVGLFVLWHVLAATEILPKFFFGEPLVVLARVRDWFVSGKIYPHLAVTLIETILAFVIGTVLGLVFGLWLALSDFAARLLNPYITALNSMPRVILAPIFAVWFGLDIKSKVMLGITLVFFIVFFSVYNGVREVSPTILANARMLGANGRQLLRHVYLPSATAWVFSSLHASVGMAFVGAVVGEYLGLGARGRLPDPAGRRRVRHQHGVCRRAGADRLGAGPRLRRDARRAAPPSLAPRPRFFGLLISGEVRDEPRRTRWTRRKNKRSR
jgi:NitT/TauT family transport system permease protein